MIRTITIFLLLSVLLSGISYYLIVSSSPIKQEKLEAIINREQISEDNEELLWSYVDSEIEDGYIFEYVSNEFYLVIGLVSVSLIFLISSIHMVIDKLFFKKFFESPSLYTALRRSVVFVSALLGLGFLYFINSEWYIVLSAPLLLLLLEILLSSMIRPRHIVEEEKLV